MGLRSYARRACLVVAGVLTLLSALASGAHAAGLPLVWRWSNPKPHGNNIAAMTFGNGWIVQVGERGQIYLSRDLDDWIPCDSKTTNDLRSATFFGSKIIVTGENGTVLYAESGLPRPEFQRIDLGTLDWLEGVAASPALQVAVGDNGATYTSHNGTVWLRQSQSFTTWLRGVAYGNGLFVTVGETGLVATSSDGVTWQRQTSGVTEHLNQIAWVQNRFVAVGDSGRTLSSSDGRSWQTVATSAANTLYTITASPSSVSVAGESELRLQENGVWSDQIRSAATSFPAPNWTYLSSLWDGSLFLLGGRTGLTVEGFKTNAASATVWVDRHDHAQIVVRAGEFRRTAPGRRSGRRDSAEPGDSRPGAHHDQKLQPQVRRERVSFLRQARSTFHAGLQHGPVQLEDRDGPGVPGQFRRSDSSGNLAREFAPDFLPRDAAVIESEPGRARNALAKGNHPMVRMRSSSELHWS